MQKFLYLGLVVCRIIFAFFLLYFALRLVHYHFDLVTFPFSSALREGSMMISTEALVKGLNPYAMSLQPQFMNEYGIIYPLMVWPLAKIFGTTILIHRIVIAFFILACCVTIFCVLKKLGVPALMNFWTVLMFYASLLYPGTSTASIDPGAIGTFFFLMTVFIPWFCQYSDKSLVISVLFAILAFYTKLYTFLGALIMMSYLFLFISKRKSLFYGCFLLPLLVLSIVLVNDLLPAYFDNCFFSEVNMAPAWASMDRLHEQIIMYRDIHRWIFILLGAFLLGYALRALLYNRDNISGYAKSIKKYLNSLKHDGLQRRLLDMRGPLINFRFSLVLFSGIWVAAVLYFSMGRNTGATLWYFFQLLSPFFLVGAAWVFSRHTFWPIVCVPFLVLNLYIITANQDYRVFNKNMPAWRDISLLISGHQHILNSPLIAPLLIQQDKEVIDDGQAEYFLLGGQRNYWMKGWLKEDDRISFQLMLFFADIRSRVENKEFDLIVLQPGLLPFGIGDDIRKYYKYEGELPVFAPQDRRPYEVTIWRPQ